MTATETKIAAPVGWFEITSNDPAAAEAFYSAVMGWEFSDGPEGPGYRIAAAGDGPAGGITAVPEGAPGTYAIFCTMVADVDATCAQIRDLGGSVLVGPETTSFGLRFANVTDPEGSHFGIFTPPAE